MDIKIILINNWKVLERVILILELKFLRNEVEEFKGLKGIVVRKVVVRNIWGDEIMRLKIWGFGEEGEFNSSNEDLKDIFFNVRYEEYVRLIVIFWDL